MYRYYDSEDTIIYIGKAKNLKKRVSSYFTKSYSQGNKIARLVSQIKRVEFSVVTTETDALFLENNLIKKHNCLSISKVFLDKFDSTGLSDKR